MLQPKEVDEACRATVQNRDQGPPLTTQNSRRPYLVGEYIQSGSKNYRSRFATGWWNSTNEELVLSEGNEISGLFIDGDTKWYIHTFVIYIGRSVGWIWIWSKAKLTMKAAFLSVWNMPARMQARQNGEMVVSDWKKPDEHLRNKTVNQEALELNSPASKLFYRQNSGIITGEKS